MKRLFLGLLVLGLISSVAFAASQVDGMWYKGLTTTALSAATPTTILQTSSSPTFKNRVFEVYNKGAGAGVVAAVTLEASIDGTHWATVDSSTIVPVGVGTTKQVRIENNPTPYWRLRATPVAATSGCTVDARFFMLTL